MTVGLVCLPRGGTRQIIAVCHALLLSRKWNKISGRAEDNAGETHETKSRYQKWTSGPRAVGISNTSCASPPPRRDKAST